MFVLFVMRSYLIEVRGLKLFVIHKPTPAHKSYLIEVRGLKLRLRQIWLLINLSYLIEVRGLKPICHGEKVSFIGRIL